MSDQQDRHRKPLGHTAEEHSRGGENPRNIPERDLNAAPAQPDAPDRSEVEQHQDQQPVRPGAVIHPPHNPTGQQKDLVNG